MNIMDDIIKLYETFGHSEYYGECVSKTDHMLQTAQAAEKKGEKNHLVLACLLHDIGHFLEKDDMNGLGVIEHGKLGADFLRQLGMSEIVCILVENHVNAKKYLVSKHLDYYNNLSDASKKTLEFQGGKMSLEEMEAFEMHPFFDDIIKMRHYDDVGKNIGKTTKNIYDYEPLISNYLRY